MADRVEVYTCVECNEPVVFEGDAIEYEPHPYDGSKYCWRCAWLEGFLNDEGQVDAEFYDAHGEQARLERGKKNGR